MMADVKIKKNLNIVFDADGFIVHHTPISYEVYRSVAEILSSTLSRLKSAGNIWNDTQAMGVFSVYIKCAERVSMMDGKEYDPQKDGLLNELQSLTTLIKNGETSSLFNAIKGGVVDEEIRDFIFGQLIFFILTSKREKTKTIKDWAEAIGALTTSLSFTEYTSSLMTSTEKDATG